MWEMVKEQVKIAWDGTVYALDLGGIALLLEKIGVEDIEWELRKLQRIFELTSIMRIRSSHVQNKQ